MIGPLPRFRSRRCTSERPWRKEDGDTFYHPDAKEIGEQRANYPCGDLVDYECPYCGRQFSIELPQ